MKPEKLIFIFIILISSLSLFIFNFADGANVFPAWLMAYSQYFFYIWFFAVIISFLSLFR
jgi:hypothetical protein